jgi:hypothetical protein
VEDEDAGAFGEAEAIGEGGIGLLGVDKEWQ